MDSSPSAHSPDVTESRPSFRRPGNDASRRNYRRHSPSSSRSPSPPSPGGWKRDRSPSHVSQEDGGVKRGRRAEPESDTGRGDVGRSRRGADGGSFDHRSQNRDQYDKSDEYNYNRRHTGYYDRNHHSNSGRDSLKDTRPDYYRRDDLGKPSRVDQRTPERTYRDRGNDEGRDRRKERLNERDRDRDKEKDRNNDKDRYRSRDRELGSGRGAKIGGRRADGDSDADIERSRDSDISREKGGRDREKSRGKDYDQYKDRDDQQERDRRRDKDEARGGDWHKDRHESKADRQRMKESFKEPSRPKVREERKERDTIRDEDDYKNRDGHRAKGEPEKDNRKSIYTHDVGKDGGTLSGGKERGFEQSRDKTWAGRDSSERREKGRKHTSEQKKLDHPTSEMHSKSEDAATGTSHGSGATIPDHVDDSVQGPGKLVLATAADERSGKGTKWGPEAEPSSEAAPTASSEAEVANDFNHAKLAAMRAAELVNKNLGAGGFMSADQKKRLLWGSKNQEPVAATGTNRWDTVQFSDRDRQEKFNKLMSLSVCSYLSPIVGRQRRNWRIGDKWGEGSCTVHSGETAGATTRSGEAIHCWSETSRWSYSWTRPLDGDDYPLNASKVWFLVSDFLGYALERLCISIGPDIVCDNHIQGLKIFMFSAMCSAH